MSTPWRLVGFAFPTDNPITLHGDPGVYVKMGMGPMLDLQWLAKRIRITVRARVRWYGDRGPSPSDPELNDVANVVEWSWEDTFSTLPANKIPSGAFPGNWNDLFGYSATGTYTTSVTPFSVYKQGEEDTPTDDTQIISYTLTPVLHIGISPSTGKRVIHVADNLSDYKIPVWGSFRIVPNFSGIDEVNAINAGEVTPVIGETEFTGSMGEVIVSGISAGECIQDYSDASDHAGISVHEMYVDVEVLELHPPPPDI